MESTYLGDAWRNRSGRRGFVPARPGRFRPRLPLRSPPRGPAPRVGIRLGTVALAAMVILMMSSASACRGGDSDKLPEDAEAEQQLLARLGEGFKVRTTPHFFIAYNTDDKTLFDFLRRVEATYRSVLRFLEYHDIPEAEIDSRLRIVFLAKRDAFHAYARSLGFDVTGAGGFFYENDNVSLFYDTMDHPILAGLNQMIEQMEQGVRESSGGSNRSSRDVQLQQLRYARNQRDALIETINQQIVQHEVAHHVLFNAGVHVRLGDNPKWLVEGLACLFETPPTTSGAGLGAINQGRLMEFHQALTGSREPRNGQVEDFKTACAAGRLAPLRELIAKEHLFKVSGEYAGYYYAEGWSLVFYLQRRKRDELGEYLKLASQRPRGQRFTPQQEVEQFEQAFGPLDEAFQRAWLEYILNLHVRWPK